MKLFGKELLTLPETEMRQIRGGDIGMVFQDPGASLNPVRKIGVQVIETYLTHRNASKSEARDAALEALRLAGIDKPDETMNLYPVDLSSGAKQRVMIAIAIICRPALLIADEPTTMLGTRMQRHILESLLKVQAELQMAMILITHDFGVVSWMADDIMVMYGGRVGRACAKAGDSPATAASLHGRADPLRAIDRRTEQRSGCNRSRVFHRTC